jgi:Asp-tRNA(Asn)/Glu-tRNA(Gln) amidotransferase C subunit
VRLTEADVRRAATSAGLRLSDADAGAMAAELVPVAALFAALRTVRPDHAGGAVGVGAGGMPLRADAGPPYQLARSAAEIAPAARAGYLLVPRAADVGVPGDAAGDASERADALAVAAELDPDA